jgi:glycosyltransferase involved in cell wall biosynthesis
MREQDGRRAERIGRSCRSVAGVAALRFRRAYGRGARAELAGTALAAATEAGARGPADDPEGPADGPQTAKPGADQAETAAPRAGFAGMAPWLLGRSLAAAGTADGLPSIKLMTEPHLRVLFANHNGHSKEGGGGRVLHETVAALRNLGVVAEVTAELYPDVSGYDLVHAFNVWPLETSLPQMRYFGEKDIPVLWEPIFSDLHEFAWAMRAVRLLNELIPDSQDWREVVAAIESSTLVIDGMSRWGPNEIVPGYPSSVAEMFEIAAHVSICSLHEIGTLARIAPDVRTPFTIVHHGVASQQFADADAKDFIDHYGLTDFILCVGNVERRKNQLLMVEAARELDRQIVLIGSVHRDDGDYLAKCCLRGGDALTHIGWLPPNLVASAYKAAAVHVLPSFAEGSALSTMEAAAAGCDIVTSNRGSEFEYYGDLARACDPLSPTSIRAAIEHALRFPRGERLANHMRFFSWARTAEATLGAYKRTIAERSA